MILDNYAEDGNGPDDQFFTGTKHMHRETNQSLPLCSLIQVHMGEEFHGLSERLAWEKCFPYVYVASAMT